MRGTIVRSSPAFDSGAERAGLFLAFGLSLSLFGLTTLEALPVSNETTLSNQSTIAFLYWISLWLLSIFVLFVVPSLVGASVATSFGHFLCCTRPGGNNATIFDSRNLPWCIRVVWRLSFGLIAILAKNVLYKGYTWCCSTRRQKTIDSSVLPLRQDLISRSLSVEIRDDSSHRSRNRSEIDSSPPSNKIDDCRQRFFAAIGGLCGIVVAVGLFGTIGPLVVQLSSTKTTSILSQIVSWLCGVGLLISSILNGFGSVSLPYTTLSGFFLEQIRPEYMTKLEGNLKNMRKILIEKQNTLKELKVQIPTLNSPRSTNQSSGSPVETFSMSSFLSKKNTTNYGFSDIGGDLKKRREMLVTEIAFMEDLVRETALDLEELKHSQMTAAAARTSIGKAKLYVGLVFSSILLIRLFNAGYSIFKSYGTLFSQDYTPHAHKKSRSDVVTSIVLWLTGHHHFSHNQYNMLSQVISLVLSAVLSFTQLRTFLRTATIVHRRLLRLYKTFFGAGENTNKTANNLSDQQSKENFLWWIISALLGCYSLACILSIKILLPERFSVAFSMALEETSIFVIRSSSVDAVFFSSALMSTAILGMLLGIQRQNISKHATILSKRGSNLTMSSLPDV